MKTVSHKVHNPSYRMLYVPLEHYLIARDNTIMPTRMSRVGVFNRSCLQHNAIHMIWVFLFITTTTEYKSFVITEIVQVCKHFNYDDVGGKS